MKRVVTLAGASLAALVGYRRRTGLDHVPASLAAEQIDLPLEDGLTVATYRRGPENERPVVLVHSVNAAASAAEMRPLFDRLAVNRRAVALDLPGYGRSTRSDIEYTPQLMAGAVSAVLQDLDQPADLVALSLGCEFAARAALDHPERVRSLALISPTGLQSRQERTSTAPWLRSLIRAPLIGEAIFGLLSTRLSIDYFLRKSYHGPIDLDMANHAHLTARHPDARFAPASFLSGALFTSHAMKALYEPLEMPVLVIADRDPYTDFGSLPEIVSRKSNWQHHRVSPNRGLPQFDQSDATAELIAAFQAG